MSRDHVAQEGVERALKRVLDDIARSSPLRLYGSVTPASREGWLATVYSDTSSQSRQLFESDEEELAVAIADWLQTSLEFDLRTPWPMCATDGKSYLPRVVAGRGTWICPDHGKAFVIGTLEQI